MGRIWESFNASNQHILTQVPNGQIAGSPLCGFRPSVGIGSMFGLVIYFLFRKYGEGGGTMRPY